ncbi:MAG: NAD(P)/FAD-dependent oxidoreductase [Saprospiraceae bacterium]|nr:NAD(P)/FAD-dependent oxidoreductase [Saprospiraceae bacterium]
MKIEHYPITIIGAGPAGAATALKLDRLGIPCILVDKATFPRDKVCGDGISHRVVDILKRWIDPAIVERFAAAQNIQLDSWGLLVEGTKNNRLDIGYLTYYNKQTDISPGFVCKRWEFDNFLVQEVKNNSLIKFYDNTEIVDFQKNTEGWLINSKNNKLVIQTQLLIVADGAQSRFARLFGGITLDPKHYMASVKAYYKGVSGFHKDNFLEFYFLKNFLPGYFWIFPLPNGEANVGIAIVSEEVSKRKLNLKKCLAEVIETTPKFKARFENAELISEVQGFGLPLGSKKRQLSGDNYLLVGDAASLIDPLTGEGIANAILSGAVAAEQAVQCLKQNDFSATILRGYDERIYRMRGQEFKMSYRLQKWFKSPLFFNTLIWIISKNKPLARTFAYVFNDTHLKKQLLQPSWWWKVLRNKHAV